jgi:hypothetical protein
MSPPREDPRAAGASAAGELPSIEELALAGDVEQLLGLAKSYRAARDLRTCLACYEAAARLGSAEAEHAVGLFCLSGGIAPQDERRAASLFRNAADKGYLPSKVYLANLYELGIYYKQDAAKADVWYRNVARAAQIGDDPSTFEYKRAMAELGCVRACLALLADPESNADERVYYARKAKAYGWRERMAAPEPAPPEPATLGDAIRAVPATPDAPAPATATAPTRVAAASAARPEPAPRARATSPGASIGAGLVAFLWAALLVAAAAGAGYLGLEGVRLLVARYGPLLGPHEERIVLGTAASLAVLGPMLVYKWKSVLQALLVAALFGALGWFTWHAPAVHLFPLHEAQAIAFGLGGFLAALLVLGVAGGAKSRSGGARQRQS